MHFGIPREIRRREMRVGLTPAGVQALAQAGQRVYVERDAGRGAGFPDDAYRWAGADIVYSSAEVYGRSDVVLKVTRPTSAEQQYFRDGQIICSFLHLAVSSPDLPQALAEHQVTAIAYEMMESDDGYRPLLLPMSEIAGGLAPLIAGNLLFSHQGGRGTLLGGIPGVPPAAIVILGAGALGISAARAFRGLGSQVTIMDKEIRKLRHVDDTFDGSVSTMLASDYSLKKAVNFADVVIGAVLSPGRRAPVLVSREMVRGMRAGSVILDFSIDQGGCVETSRPTSLQNPTYVEEGTVHYCVPNATAVVARSTSHAITNAFLPYALDMARYDLPDLLRRRAALHRGTNTYNGQVVHPDVAMALGIETDDGWLP